MPSRERVVTTITTELDEENGKDVVISETVEIQSARCLQTDVTPPSKLNTPATASPSPQKSQSKSKSQLRKKRENNIPCNQKTLSNFFKPKAGKKQELNSHTPPSKIASKTSTKEQKLSPPRKSVSEVPGEIPSVTRTVKSSSTSECSSSPSNKSDASSHPSFIAPMEEIRSIVLGAHDEAAFKPSPISSTNSSRKVRGLDVKAILPSMVMCHDVSLGDEAVKSENIKIEQAKDLDTATKCEDVSSKKRKDVSPMASLTSIDAPSRKKIKMATDSSQLETLAGRDGKDAIGEMNIDSVDQLQPRRKKFTEKPNPTVAAVTPPCTLCKTDAEVTKDSNHEGKVDVVGCDKEKVGVQSQDSKKTNVGEMKIGAVNQLQPRRKNPTEKSNPTNAAVTPPGTPFQTDAEVTNDINHEGKADVACVDKVRVESKDSKKSNVGEMSIGAVNLLLPRKKNPTGKSDPTVAAIKLPGTSCKTDAEVTKDSNHEGKADVVGCDKEKFGVQSKDSKKTNVGEMKIGVVNLLQPRRKNLTEKPNPTVAAIKLPGTSCKTDAEVTNDINHEGKADLACGNELEVQSKDAKSYVGKTNICTVNLLQPKKKNPTEKSNPADAQVTKDSNREGKADAMSVNKVGVQAKDRKTSNAGEMNIGAINQLRPKMKNPAEKPNPTVAAVTPPGMSCKTDAELTIDNNRKGKADMACGDTVGVQAKDVKSTTQEYVLSPEDSSLVLTYENMRLKYIERIKELVQRVVLGEIEEEDFQNHLPQDDHEIPSANDVAGKMKANEVKDEWLNELSLTVQGSSLPVDALARMAQNKILGVFGSDTVVSLDALASKIKVIATRTQYLFPLPECSNHVEAKVDIFSNTNPEFMWRWELISLDLLPDELKSTVKNARSVRRKLKSQHKAMIKLIQSINDAVSCMRSMAEPSKKQMLIAKVSVEEEKVLKFEREEEKARILNDAKRQKELQKAIAKQQRDLEKKHQDDEKRKEKERQDEIRKAEKAQKLEEKEKKKKEANDRKAAAEEKRKSRMLAFFKKPQQSPKALSSLKGQTCTPVTLSVAKVGSFDSHEFWRQLGVGERVLHPFVGGLTSKAKHSKSRKVRKANVRVFVPTVSENPFERQVYDEERTISIRNKYKFLSFKEDYRPPYHGTWSKSKSRVITGRNPFAKDSSFLDYDVDSEAEWEEGDDEQGEDCSENGNDEDEVMDDDEGDITNYNYQDGWLAEDGDLELEDDDEETHELRKKKIVLSNTVNLEGGKSSKLAVASVIAPSFGGIPLIFSSPKKVSDFVEGIDVPDGLELMNMQSCEIFPIDPLCLEPFPPSLSKVSVKKTDQAQKIAPQEMSRDDLITFAKFVHNSKLKSKDLVVEQLRNTHKHITSSRAQATRKLDSIAEKRRLKNGAGVIWEVKNEVLESLGLHDLMKTEEIDDSTIAKGTVTVTESKTNALAAEKAARHQSENEQTTTDEVAQKVSLCSLNANVTDNNLQPCKSPSKKRKAPTISKASANLLASFLKKKKVSNS